MPISKGAPIVWQEIVDLVNTHYPGEPYDSLTAVAFTGRPLTSNAPNVPVPAPFLEAPYSAAVAVAMLCPPNSTVRPSSRGGLALLDPVTGITSGGAALLSLPGQPLEAPDWFEELSTGTYTGASAFTNMGNDIQGQLIAFLAANPTFRWVAVLESYYVDFAPPFATAANGLVKIAGKQIV